MLKVINRRNYLNMFKKLLRRLFHIAFLFKRPLTVGMRAICYDAGNNSVLLVRHIYTDDWSLPGGGIETGESFDNALVRELCAILAVKPIKTNHMICSNEITCQLSKAKIKEIGIIIDTV